eukprot:7378417-Prymnesium_polylepis.2
MSTAPRFSHQSFGTPLSPQEWPTWQREINAGGSSDARTAVFRSASVKSCGRGVGEYNAGTSSDTCTENVR